MAKSDARIQCVVDRSRRIEMVNAQSGRLFNYPREDSGPEGGNSGACPVSRPPPINAFPVRLDRERAIECTKARFPAVNLRNSTSSELQLVEMQIDAELTMQRSQSTSFALKLVVKP